MPPGYDIRRRGRDGWRDHPPRPPGRRLAGERVRVGAHALVLVQRADRLDVLTGELEVEDVDVLCDALGLDRLREDDVAAQDNLGRRLPDPAGDGDDLRVVEHSPPADRGPGLDGDLMLSAEGAHV